MSSFEQVATLADFGTGDRIAVVFDDRAVVVFRVGTELYAVEDVCSHDGQPLTDGPLANGSVECPRHGARFDLKTGRPLCMPAVEPINVYKVKLEGDNVLLGVSMSDSLLPLPVTTDSCTVPPLPEVTAIPAVTDPAKPVDEGQLLDALRQVIDPELMINIVDLGLVYAVAFEDATVKVEMTLTSPACPAGPQIVGQSKQALERLAGVKAAEIKLVLSPPWTPERMTDEARDQLGIF